MILRAGGCYGGELPGYRSAGFLVNGDLLLDAGTAASALSWEEQLAVRAVCVSHGHLDHVKDLAFLADNRAGRAAPLVVTGTRAVVESVRRELFNGRLWPDFSRLPSRRAPAIAYRHLPEGRWATVAGLRVKAVPVSHTVASAGFLLREPGASVAYSGDTGPTRALWKAARALPDLKGVFVEASFPNGMEEVAVATGHLTPALLERELDLLGRPEVPVHVIHMKPMHLEQIAADLRRITRYRVAAVRQGRTYTFS